MMAKPDMLFSRIYPDYKKLLNYLFVGIVATLADMAFLYIFTGYAGIYYVYATIMSYIIGMIISFYLNKYYNFKNTYKKVHYQFATFALVACSGLLLNTILMYGFVNYLFANDESFYVMTSKIIVAGIVFIWNFLINKSFTFKVFK